MSDWIADALVAVRRGERLAMVTVVGVQGSAPRETGARMLVWPDRFIGTIGGGSLERQGLNQGRRLLVLEDRRHALQDYPLGPLLGQCCGGHVRLLVERLDGASLGWLEAACAAAVRGEAFQLTASLHSGRLERSVSAAPVAADSPRTPLSQVRTLSETILPARQTLLIFGAGHVGQAVARTFAALPFDLIWLASREDLAPETDGAQAQVVAEDDLVARIAAAPAGAMVAIFTHSHDLDFRLTRAALARTDLAYVGLIGSATKRRRFERRLRDDGVEDAALARLTCPIGIPGLKNKAPAVIAVSLAAELLQRMEAL